MKKLQFCLVAGAETRWNPIRMHCCRLSPASAREKPIREKPY